MKIYRDAIYIYVGVLLLKKGAGGIGKGGGKRGGLELCILLMMYIKYTEH